GAVAATPGVDAVGRAVPAASGERSGIDLPSTDVAADSLPALSPGLVLRGDGKPFKTEETARLAAKNRRLQGYEPVQVEGGWALAPIGAAPLSTTQGEAYAAQEGEIAQGDQLEHPQADQGRGAAAAASGGDSVEARGQEPGASQEVSQEADTAPAG